MSADHDSLCWRPDWLIPSESLWSLLKKFSYLNAATYPDIWNLVRRPVSEEGHRNRRSVRRDLNSFAQVDEEKLKHFLHIDPIALGQSTALAYIRPDEIGTLTSNQLRYCVPCIRAGFHTAIHQFLFVSHCPVHLSPLVTRCTACGVMSPRYTLTSIRQRPYKRCDQCFSSFTDNFIRQLNGRPQESRELFDFTRWLEERLSANWIENYMLIGSFFRSPSKCRNKKLLRMRRYWSYPLPFNSESTVPRLPNRENHHSLLTTTDALSVEPILDEYGQLAPDFENELQTNFRAISRNLVRRVLRKHKRCIRRMQEHICWVAPGSYWRGRTCVAANAFLLWLMRCQNINDPTRLFHRKTRLRILPVDTVVETNKSLTRSAVRRILALNWSSLFYEALLVAYGLNRKGLYSLCPALVEGVRRPYWLVEWPTAESQILHWWMHNRFTARIVSDKTLCPGPGWATTGNRWRTKQCTCLT